MLFCPFPRTHLGGGASVFWFSPPPQDARIVLHGVEEPAPFRLRCFFPPGHASTDSQRYIGVQWVSDLSAAHVASLLRISYYILVTPTCRQARPRDRAFGRGAKHACLLCFELIFLELEARLARTTRAATCVRCPLWLRLTISSVLCTVGWLLNA